MMWLHVFVIRKTSEVIVENIKVQNSVCHMLLFVLKICKYKCLCTHIHI